MIAILFLVFGIIIGSFCNVLILRIKNSMSLIKPHSHCFSCKKKIRWIDNIPLFSFFILKGKCRKCKTKISWQYPLTEFFVGFFWFWIGFFYEQNLIEKLSVAILWCLVFSALWVIFVYDWKYMEIPMEILYSALVLVFIINFLNEDLINLKEDFFATQFFYKIIAGIIAFLFFFGLSFISNEEWMGYGDAFVVLLIGLGLGSSSFFAILTAFCVGAIFSLVNISFGKVGLKSQIPFGPFLIFGFIIVFFLNFFSPNFIQSFFY